MQLTVTTAMPNNDPEPNDNEDGTEIQPRDEEQYNVGQVVDVTIAEPPARRNTANPESGLGLELDVITAVVVGGTSIYGGRGSIAGTVLGILLIHEARELVNWRWSSAELNMVVVGSLLIVSVLAHRLLAPRGKAGR